MFESIARRVMQWALLLSVMNGCGFSSRTTCGSPDSRDFIGCVLNQSTAIPEISHQERIVYEAPGLIRVVHGTSCIQTPGAVHNGALGYRVHDRTSVPFSIAETGTVFLNGWDLKYHNEDHHVFGLGTAIFNVTESTQGDQFVLDWDAGGVLSDEDGDDPYDWCYWYTAVFWSRKPGAFDAIVGQRGLSYQLNSGGAQGSLDASTSVPGGQGVRLPQGFAMLWNGSDVDHHLLQAGYDLGPTSKDQLGNLNWTTRAVFQDNSNDNAWVFGEMVQTVQYSSPQVLTPQTVSLQTVSGWVQRSNSLSLQSEEGDIFCGGVDLPVVDEHFKIENLPFQYAAPVMRGWEVGYACSDQHVRKIGAEITEFHYDRAADASSGTLYYTLSAFVNDDNDNAEGGGAVIDVFGMNSRGSSVAPVDPPPPASCSFAGQTIPHGGSVEAFRSRTSPPCGDCEPQVRTCNDGTLSGSYEYDECVAVGPAKGKECP